MAERLLRAYERDPLRFARGLEPQVRPPPCPGVRQVGMRERFGFIGKQQRDVAGSSLGAA